jgi:hypothetical protein
VWKRLRADGFLPHASCSSPKKSSWIIRGHRPSLKSPESGGATLENSADSAKHTLIESVSSSEFFTIALRTDHLNVSIVSATKYAVTFSLCMV